MCVCVYVCVCVCHRHLFNILSYLTPSNMQFQGILGMAARLQYPGLTLVGFLCFSREILSWLLLIVFLYWHLGLG